MKIYIFLVFFLLVGAFMIVSNNNLHLGQSEDFNVFMDSYYGWFFKIFDNFKTVSSNVIGIDWLP